MYVSMQCQQYYSSKHMRKKESACVGKKNNNTLLYNNNNNNNNKLFEMLNRVIQEYAKFPLSKLLCKKINIEIIGYKRTELVKLNQIFKVVKKVDLLAFNLESLILIKINTVNHLIDPTPFLNRNTIVLQANGVNSSNILLKVRMQEAPILGILFQDENQIQYDQLNQYLDIIQTFYKHLNIRVLAYPGNQLTMGQFSVQRNLFQKMEELMELPEEALEKVYLRELLQSANISSFEDLKKDLNAFGLNRNWGEIYFSVLNRDSPSTLVICKDRLPDTNQSLKLQDIPVLIKTVKIIKHVKTIGWYEVEFRRNGNRANRENQLQNFGCLINLKINQSEQLHREIYNDLNCCFMECFKYLQLEGWHSNREESLQEQLQSIYQLCEMLDLDRGPLIKRLLL